MKNRIKFLLIIVFVASSALAIKFYISKNHTFASTPTLPTGHLFPSVKTTTWMPGNATDWLATHYDWVDAMDAPIDNWYAKNPNIIGDIYFQWGALSFVGDYDPQAKQDFGAKWYSYCANPTNGCNWEDGLLHLGGQDTFVASNRWLWDSQDAEIRYVFAANSSGVISPSVSNQYIEQNWRNSTWGGWQASGQTSPLNLQSMNSAVYFGRLDLFDEIDFNISSSALNWQKAYEYWNGSNWVSLSIISDTTNNGQQNGQIRFTPPTASQWQRNQVNSYPTYWGSQGVYYVRVRTTGGTGPIIDKASGRHYYVHAADSSGNTIPAWDSANDRNGDGYIDDVEYASRANANASARFRYEARTPHYWSYGLYSINLKNSLFMQKISEFSADVLDAAASVTHKYIGVRLDDCGNINNVPPEVRNSLLEYPGLTQSQMEAQWYQDFASLLASGRTYLHDRNYLLGGGVISDTVDIYPWDQINQNLDFHTLEGWWNSNSSDRAVTPGFYGNWEEKIWPAISQWQKWGDAGTSELWQWWLVLYNNMGENSKTINITNSSINVTGNGTRWIESVQPGSIINFRISGTTYWLEVAVVNSDTSLTLKAPFTGPTTTNQSAGILSARDKIDGLTTFLVKQKPETDYFMMWQGNYYGEGQDPYYNWIPAEAKDFGQPTGIVPTGKSPRGTRGAYVFSTGIDPSVTNSNKYFIYGRDYTKALVLNRPITGGGSYFSNSAVTLPLPTTDTWYPMDYFGNISTTPVTQVNLTNADGIILMKGSAINGVTLTKSVDKNSASPGQTLTYTISYKVGNQNATNVKIEDNIPNGTTYISVANGGTFDSVNNKVTWNLGNLATGATGSVSFQVRIQ